MDNRHVRTDRAAARHRRGCAEFMLPSSSVQIMLVNGAATGVAASRLRRAGRGGDRAGRKGRHGFERDEARNARDRCGRAGSALREPGGPRQGRPAREALHFARIGDFFTSFDDACWFLARREPLECFYDQFPTDEQAMFEGWIVEPPSDVKAAAASVQERLEEFEWLQSSPTKFFTFGWAFRNVSAPLHSGGRGSVDSTSRTAGRTAFTMRSFWEVAAPIRQLVAGTKNDVPTFLPHLDGCSDAS